MDTVQDNSEKTTVEHLLTPAPAIRGTTTCSGALDIFHRDKTLNSLTIVDERLRPIGMIARHDITEIFSKPYVNEFMGQKPISTIMDPSPIIVDIGTEIEDVVRIILDAGIQHIVRGFIITRNHKYEGVGKGYDLINRIMEYRQNRLFGLAHFDQLTKLPNRTLLLDRLNQAIATAARSQHKLSILFIDLDGFKLVNDLYGHDAGDRLLKEAATRLITCIREGDTAARLGGDEFVIILIDSDLERTKFVATRIIENLCMIYDLGSEKISSLSASIGIAAYPDHGKDVDELLVAADTAMYAAKRSGKSQFAVYAQDYQLPSEEE